MPPSSLTVVVQSRALDRIHYALMLAASAAATGAATTLFFAIEGVEALKPGAFEALRTAAGESAEDYGARLKKANAAAPDELLEALAELGARFAACDTGLAVAGAAPSDLREDLGIDVTGLTEILASAGDDRIIYV